MEFMEFYWKTNISFFKKALAGYKLGLLGIVLVILGSVIMSLSSVIWLDAIGSGLSTAGVIIVVWANIAIISKWFRLADKEPDFVQNNTNKEEAYIEKHVIRDRAKLYKANLLRGLIAGILIFVGVWIQIKAMTSEFKLGLFILSIILILAAVGFFIWAFVSVLLFHINKYAEMKEKRK